MNAAITEALRGIAEDLRAARRPTAPSIARMPRATPSSCCARRAGHPGVRRMP
jgi:hypothetical protein